ncbi:MAG TPA: hypothetical protein VHH73_13235 [Verrucomicrobiae bacterium]|nr:hypothetical protein [Verrucomicrobiae bacterium]
MTPDAAFKAFREFAGPGWLQDARVPKVLLFDDGICPQLDAAWPEHGERVSDDKNSSVQLRRVATGWRLTTLTRLSGNEARVLMQERRLRNDLSSHVVYEVAWEPVSIGAAPFAHDELRPVASRFLGFAPR